MQEKINDEISKSQNDFISSMMGGVPEIPQVDQKTKKQKVNKNLRKHIKETQSELTLEEAKKGKSRLQKWAERVSLNQEIGKIKDENFQNELARRDMEIDSIKHSNALASLEVFYGDKNKAMKVHVQNMKIDRKNESKKNK